VLSIAAYSLVEANYRSIVAPALATPEGRAGLAAAMRPALSAILAFDAVLLALVGLASYALARAALFPLVLAREREERFTADVAHELRTPLAAIASVVQVGRARASTSNAADAAAFASIARRAIDCGALVGDLLTLARGAGAHDLEREPVDLAIVVRHALRDGASDASDASGAPEIAVDVRLESALVSGDERRLAQLARNLVANARAHARTHIAVRVARDGDDAILEVDDDGPGVEAALVPRLFERFAKGSTSRGSGLGLAIVRWVARAHGGDVTHAGSARFVVRLPALREGASIRS